MTLCDLASSDRSLSFSRSSSLTLTRRGLVFGPRFLERASWLCWWIILRHLSDLGGKETLSSQQRTLSSLGTGVVLL
jgi:hypothetical protein